VDTGMGFERVTAMIQCTNGLKDFTRPISNYETDVFTPIFRELEKLSGKKYSSSLQDAGDIAFRVIADHIRCLSFAIADGIIPSNEGRGYVLRRILRRAIRYGRNLGFREPFFYKLVDVIVANFAEVFPEVRTNHRRIQDTLKAEEESFNRTLDRGIELFEQVVASGGVFPATEAFKLYDTFGFPLDLTELMARERGLTVDVTGFEQLMEEQRRRARADHAKKKAVISVAGEGLQVEPTKFLGYDNLEAEAVVVAASPCPVGRGAHTAPRRTEGSPPDQESGEFELIVDQTPFYAEIPGWCTCRDMTGRRSDGWRCSTRKNRAMCTCTSAGCCREIVAQASSLRPATQPRWLRYHGARQKWARRCAWRWTRRGAPTSSAITRSRICFTGRCTKW
jgi:alanyl-tRNA synthetase